MGKGNMGVGEGEMGKGNVGMSVDGVMIRTHFTSFSILTHYAYVLEYL